MSLNTLDVKGSTSRWTAPTARMPRPPSRATPRSMTRSSRSRIVAYASDGPARAKRSSEGRASKDRDRNRSEPSGASFIDGLSSACSRQSSS